MNKHLKILLLEDSESDAGLIQRELKRGNINFTAKVVDTKDAFENAIKNFNPDVILSDNSLPSFNSMDALFIVKENNVNVPFILVTGTVSEEFAVLSVKEGADDYILKSNLTRLPSAIIHALKTRQAEQEKEKTTQQLIAKNKELYTFIYKATHDLRGPLCSIIGLTNIAEKEEKKDKLHDYINKISDSAHKLDAILLSFIETMSIKDSNVLSKKIDFKNLLNVIFKRLEFINGFKRINFQINISNSNIFYSDDRLLSSVLQNIIENAIKYQNTSINNPFVAISISNISSAIRIEIADNGVGIDTEAQDKVFDMFYRGNLDAKGSGLGLYLVKNGVEKLGGTIELKSEIKNGTTFTILIPTLKS